MAVWDRKCDREFIESDAKRARIEGDSQAPGGDSDPVHAACSSGAIQPDIPEEDVVEKDVSEESEDMRVEHEPEQIVAPSVSWNHVAKDDEFLVGLCG